MTYNGAREVWALEGDSSGSLGCSFVECKQVVANVIVDPRAPRRPLTAEIGRRRHASHSRFDSSEKQRCCLSTRECSILVALSRQQNTG
jgi:hypothetical protein